VQRNRRQEAHVRKRMAVWSIEKKRFEKDWKKTIWLFDMLMWTVVSYRVKIWD